MNKNEWFSDSIKGIIKVCDRLLQRSKSDPGQNWRLLSEHLSNNTITSNDVDKIVQNITNTVADFHASGLVTGDFDTSDIHVVADGEVSTDKNE